MFWVFLGGSRVPNPDASILAWCDCLCGAHQCLRMWVQLQMIERGIITTTYTYLRKLEMVARAAEKFCKDPRSDKAFEALEKALERWKPKKTDTTL